MNKQQLYDLVQDLIYPDLPDIQEFTKKELELLLDGVSPTTIEVFKEQK